MTSTTSCPEGLLFNGGIGRGGICTWPDMVVCHDDDDASESVVTEATAVATSVATSAATTASSQQTVSNESTDSSSLPSPWKQYLDPKSNDYYYHNPETGVTTWDHPGELTASSSSPASTTASSTTASTSSSASNPNNYYCGKSRTDAAIHCHPCPSGSLLDCDDVTHGCFRGIDVCASAPAADDGGAGRFSDSSSGGSSSAGGSSSGTSTTSSGGSQEGSTGLEELLNNLANSQSEAKQPSSNTVSNPSSPSIATSINTLETKPTEAPTLPPWTNAPFVPYRGEKRDKTVIGYYVSFHLFV